MFNYEKLKQKYFFLKLRELKHRFTYSKKYKMQRLAMERFKKTKNKKSLRQIKEEIKLCKKYWDCYPLHYFRYDLYRANMKLSEDELINFIPEFFFYNIYLPCYNTNKYDILFSEKNITEQLFRSISIAHPKTICRVINTKLYDTKLNEIEFNNIIGILAPTNVSTLFVKPSEGQGGNGIFIFKRNLDGSFIYNNVKFSKEFLFSIGTKEDYIIEEGIKQDGEISNIYPNAVNTFRIHTENKKECTRILWATFRMGRSGSELDNSSQNGLTIRIDTETGELGNYAYTERSEQFHEHPDTHYIFKNAIITKWDQLQEFVINSAKKIPQITFIGWDIALSQSGPTAIEANLNFGIDPQNKAIPLRKIFQIEDPNYYWKKRGENV